MTTFRRIRREGATVVAELGLPCPQPRSIGLSCGCLYVSIHDHGHAWCVLCGRDRTDALPRPTVDLQHVEARA